LQQSQETFEWLFYTGSEDQRRDISAEPERGQKIEEHVVTDLDVCNDENRRSLTSGAAAEERQEVSPKNTIDRLADAITGGKGIGLWSSNIPEKMRDIGWKTEFF